LLKRYDEALDHVDQALVLARETGNLHGQIAALNCIGQILSGTDRPDDALPLHRNALTMARACGDRREVANAHDGIAQAEKALGHVGRARDHWQQALDIYTDMRFPEAGDVRARLADLDSAATPR
jgi:tetratricopeptide (TPR) repeat protein